VVFLNVSVVTRWARGTNANKKKPLEASDWSEMKSARQHKAARESREADKTLEKVECLNKGKHKLEDNGVNIKLKVSKMCLPSPVTDSGFSLVEELERPDKGAPLKKEGRLDTLVLEEFVKKDRRRENRRVKRQETKMQSRVSKLNVSFVLFDSFLNLFIFC